MKKFLVIVLTCLLLFSAGYVMYSDFGMNHQQDQAGNQSQDEAITQFDWQGGPWPPPDEA